MKEQRIWFIYWIYVICSIRMVHFAGIYQVKKSRFVTAECDSFGMTLRMPTLIESQTSIGSLQVNGYPTTPECVAGVKQNFTLHLPFGKNVCGKVMFDDDTQVLLFFSALSINVRTSYDGFYTVTCKGAFKGKVTLTNELQNVHIVTMSPEEIAVMIPEFVDLPDSSKTQMIALSDVYKEHIIVVPNTTAPPLQMTFWNEQDIEIRRSKVNDPVTMKIEVVGVFKDEFSIRPMACRALPYFESENVWLPLFVGSCPFPAYKDVLGLKQFQVPNPSKQYIVQSELRAFSFVSAPNNMVVFQCVMRVCPRDDTDCLLEPCLPSRKKRSSNHKQKRTEYSGSSNNHTVSISSQDFLRSTVYHTLTIDRPSLLTRTINTGVQLNQTVRMIKNEDKMASYAAVVIISTFAIVLSLSLTVIAIVVIIKKKRKATKETVNSGKPKNNKC